MARPRKTEADSQPATEREPAPETATLPPQPVYQPPQAPRQMRVERQGAQSEPYTRRFPMVRGGICEYCGVLDSNTASQYQYKMCPHYRGMQLRCSYCPENKDPDEIIYHANLNIAEHPDNPSTLIVWCDSYECSRAHEKRFKRATA
jgi:hypothetical protein